jgi:hypothetical protein
MSNKNFKIKNGLEVTSHITSSGPISSSEAILAKEYKGSGFGVIDISGTNVEYGKDSNITIIGIGRSSAPTKNISLFGPITASGNMSSSGNIIANQITASGTIEIGSNKKLYLNKGDDTYIQSMAGDIARVVAGGNQMLLLDYDTGNRAVFGNGTKVYIGANNNYQPSQELVVAGDISASGNINSKYLDYYRC